MIYFISAHKNQRALAATNDQSFAKLFQNENWQQVSFWRYWAYKPGLDKLFVK